MPFIHTRTNRPISQEEEKSMAKQYGQAVAALGKSESWLMLHFEGDCRMYFKGDHQKPLAFVSVKLFGKAGSAAYQRMTGRNGSLGMERFKLLVFSGGRFRLPVFYGGKRHAYGFDHRRLARNRRGDGAFIYGSRLARRVYVQKQ